LAHGEQLDAPPLTGWEESVVMAAGLAGKDAARFIHAVRADNILLGDNLPLAGLALAEALLQHPDLEPLAQTVRAELLKRQRDKGAHLNARLQAGRALGELGHPDFVAQDFSFEGRVVRAIPPPLVPVAAGEFIFGSDPKDKDATSDEFTTERRVTLPAYEIGRYPVTNAEYAFFMQAGGYHDERWWSDAGKLWKQGKPDAHDGAIEDYLQQRTAIRDYGVERAAKEFNWPASRTRYWRELIAMDDDAAKRRAAQIFERPFDRPGYWEDPEKNNPAQPVVGVNWFEADAYCNWLSAITGRTFRLAHEQEWEKAARGTNGYFYPWGNVFDRARCNSLESHILNTSPVGIFGDGISPFHGHDFSGNVWEWTNDWYQVYAGGDANASADFGEKYRVVRGGSWLLGRRHVRAAYRLRSEPMAFNINIGFRVVRVPPRP
jgi:formylglycine-generating enzyme required for sulfatase activity